MKKVSSLAVRLGLTEQLAKSFQNMVSDYLHYFNKNANDFEGEKKTYSPREGQLDDPSMRANKLVVTTVKEKLDWFKKTAVGYLQAVFDVEATNASGTAKAELVVGGKSWGEFTSLELLRLKSIVESGTFTEMLTKIPVVSDSVEWFIAAADEYAGRAIFEQAKVTGVKKTTVKESYILTDPNVASGKVTNYSPQLGTKDSILELGDYTHQKFSGATTHRKRAEMLQRRTDLIASIAVALKKANEVPAISSGLSAEKVLTYIFEG
jgi:hypothetical protein